MKSGGQSLIEKGHHLAHPHFHDVFNQHNSDFVHLAHPQALSFLEVRSEYDNGCFDTFNPGSQDEYNKVVQNWADVYLQMSQLVAEKLGAGQSGDASKVF